MERHNTLEIRTPEGISFALTLAGPISRFAAWVVDFVCILVITTALGLLARVTALFSLDAAQALSAILFFVVSVGYPIFCEWRLQGQTIGKRLLSIRVMDSRGFGLRLSQIAVRNLLRFVDLLPLCYLVGGLACVISPRRQRLGDLAADTIVIRDAPAERPDFDQLVAPKYNSLRPYPHLIARLRRHVTQRQADIALDALLRRDELEPLARISLFEEIAGQFKGLVPMPGEVVEGVSDEQFVRNMVDVLYGTQGKRRGDQVTDTAASTSADNSHTNI